MNSYLLLSFAILYFISQINAQTVPQFNPCDGLFHNYGLLISISGKSEEGGGCKFDSDCTGLGVQCLRGVCRCHPSYARQQNTDNDGVVYITCEKSVSYM
jgi:hypothetical protein